MEMWGSVVVHKAVVAPLCPYLARLCQDAEGVEDQKIIFSDVPVEIIKSVVELHRQVHPHPCVQCQGALGLHEVFGP